MKQKTLIAVAAVLMLGGLWWQFQGSPNGSANTSEPVSPTTAAAQTNQTDGPDQTNETDQAEEPDGPEDYFDQEDPTNPTTTKDDAKTAASLADPEDLDKCVPVQNGFGIEMKDWGRVRLPYANGWPKNEPGTPVDCAPETDFGAAVVAAHTLHLESLSPELIPELAKDTVSRQQRIDSHPGGRDPADLDRTCEPVGWDRQQPGIYIWTIFHRCGDDPIKYTNVRMQHENGRWVMVYGPFGRVNSNEPEPGTQYYPFEGGD